MNIYDFLNIWGKPLCQGMCGTLRFTYLRFQSSRGNFNSEHVLECSFILDAASNDTNDRVEVEGPCTGAH